ncbi:MAG: HAD-IB family phosphatase [Methylomonas sp.]|jgi:phosphoserine phosphatase
MSFQVICFDCDSTLSRIEGIDELARHNGMFAEIAALTDAAMNGELALRDVYARRLALIKPSKADLDWLADLYIEARVDGVSATMQTLRDHGKQIHIVSGGLRQAILPLAASLAIPEQHVHAVDAVFSADGAYRDFDRLSPLTQNGGKAEICRRLRLDNPSLALVGDGSTDLEAKQAGAYVIGFGGVLQRQVVKEQADCYVSEPSLQAILPYVL